MASPRLYGLLSTLLLVVGALAVGQALHLTVVTGRASYASPAFVLQFGIGLVLIALGYRARRPVAEAYGLASDEREGDPGGGSRSSDSGATTGYCRRTDEEAEFDPSVSPLGESAPGDAERRRAERADSDRDGADGDRGGPDDHRDGSEREGAESAGTEPDTAGRDGGRGDGN